MRLAEYMRSRGLTKLDPNLFVEINSRKDAGLDPSSDCWPSPTAPLLVGESPGRYNHPDAPLFPVSRSSGAKLLELSGLPMAQFLRSFRRRNLFREAPDKWTASDARMAWQELPHTEAPEHWVLLGRRVAAAGGFRDTAVVYKAVDGVWCIPHPSGLNRAYNDAGVRAQVAELLRRLAGEA
jgi:hypothetical protein